MVNRNAKINGLPLADILLSISATFDGNYEYLDGKYKYIPIEYYESRLTKVVGAAGYCVEYPCMDIQTLPSEQVVAKARAIIYLYDDNGNACYKADGWGTYEVKKGKNNGNYQFLNNLGVNAKINAFKSACDSMQMFGKHYVGEKTDRKPAGNNSGSHSEGKKGLPKQTYAVSTDGAFNITRHDQEGKAIYEAEVMIANTKAVVIFYPNQYKSCQEQFNNLVMSAERRKLRVNLFLSELSGKDIPTYIFKGFNNGGK